MRTASAPPIQPSDLELTFLFPCLNEAETVAACIGEVTRQFAEHGLEGEVLVADNGSTDGSPELARAAGARVIHVVDWFPDVPRRGYGTGLTAGLMAARGRFVVLADSDGSYDVSSLPAFVAKLREGFDLVMGNRFRGGIRPGAMPPLHRFPGNPMMTLLGRTFFAAPIGDVNCGIRGCRRDAVLGLGLSSMGMEFAIEMVAKASLEGLRITEVPTILRPDGRSRRPHLRTFHDGWRQLRFMLLYSPRWLFLYPGLALLILGGLLMSLIVWHPVRVLGVRLDVHSLILAGALITIGSQTVLSFLLANQHATAQGVLPSSERFERFLKAKSLERAVLLGGVLVVLGLAGVAVSAYVWARRAFGDLDIAVMMRVIVPSATALVVGVQLIAAGFLSSVLELRGNPVVVPGVEER
ncbi:MAG: glycosyltransferase family 2 protein [Candidatus Eisenbacteria bacterium]|nr:glycosyltransferase family 2 protein [Candidatus Eisenbacteria bacterium]